MNKPEKLDTLTSLRFFAAVMIVLLHINPVFGAFGLVDLFPLDQGVSFFFVLSGFILAYNYPNLTKEADILAFLKARFARIYPNHLAAIVLLILLTSNLNVGRDLPIASFAAIANLFLFQSLIPIRKVFFSFNSVSWSISTEMFFYFVFPWLIAKGILTWRFKLILLISIVLLYLWFVTAWNIPHDRMDLQSASVEGLLYINPIVRVLEFFSGILAYFTYIRFKNYLVYSSLIFTGLEITVVLLVLLTMHFSMHLAIIENNRFSQTVGFYFSKSGSFPVFALLIIIFAVGKGQLSRFLSLKPMILLGEISFALYLVHRTILEWYQQNVIYFKQLPVEISVIIYWLLILLISYLFHVVIEKPCRKLIIALPQIKFLEALKLLFSGRQTVYIIISLILITVMTNINRLTKPNPCPNNLCQSLMQSKFGSNKQTLGRNQVVYEGLK